MPHIRLSAIQTHSPVPVRMIAKWPAKRGEEQRLHRLFRECRSHNEWFFMEGPILSFVEKMSGVGLANVAEWDELRWDDRKGVGSRTKELRSSGMKKAWAAAKLDPKNSWLTSWRQRQAVAARMRPDIFGPETRRRA